MKVLPAIVQSRPHLHVPAPQLKSKPMLRPRWRNNSGRSTHTGTPQLKSKSAQSSPKRSGNWLNTHGHGWIVQNKPGVFMNGMVVVTNLPTFELISIQTLQSHDGSAHVFANCVDLKWSVNLYEFNFHFVGVGICNHTRTIKDKFGGKSNLQKPLWRYAFGGEPESIPRP